MDGLLGSFQGHCRSSKRVTEQTFLTVLEGEGLSAYAKTKGHMED